MKRTILAIAVLALVARGAAQAPAGYALPADQQLFKLLNMVRQNARVPALQWDSRLAEAAHAHAQKLAGHNDLSHRYPGEPDLTQRVRATGALVSAVAENIAVAGEPEEVHLALMNSPGHRANILNPQYNAVGIGAVRIDNQLYVTEDFARVVPAYSGQQFRDGVVAAVNRLRQSKGVHAIEAHPDAQLDRAACSGRSDPAAALQGLPGATRVMIFTATSPGDLPPPMEKAASDAMLRRMSIGVCFRPDVSNSFAKFWVVAVFFPGK